jgi:hypothetical protein
MRGSARGIRRSAPGKPHQSLPALCAQNEGKAGSVGRGGSGPGAECYPPKSVRKCTTTCPTVCGAGRLSTHFRALYHLKPVFSRIGFGFEFSTGWAEKIFSRLHGEKPQFIHSREVVKMKPVDNACSEAEIRLSEGFFLLDGIRYPRHTWLAFFGVRGGRRRVSRPQHDS